MKLPPILSSFEGFVRASGDVRDDEHEQVHQLRSWPWVAVVDESEVDEWIAQLNRRTDIAVASRNWRVSLASPLTDLAGTQVDRTAIREFLSPLGLPPSPPLGYQQPVRVAVVDSGVDPGVFLDNVAPGIDAMQIDAVALDHCLRTNPHDPDGHGSVVAGIIHALAPTAAITSIRCFGRGGSSISDVVYGLLFGRLLREPIDVYNLSFSVDFVVEACPVCGHEVSSVDSVGQLAQLFGHLRLALDDRPIFVAAGGRKRSLAAPACLPGIIAVGSIGDSRPDAPFPDPAYVSVTDRFVLTHGGSKGKPVTSTRSGERTFYGTSFATAAVTGVVARLLGGRDLHGLPATRDETRSVELMELLRRHTWTGFAGYDQRRHGMGLLRRLPLEGVAP